MTLVFSVTPRCKLFFPFSDFHFLFTNNYEILLINNFIDYMWQIKQSNNGIKTYLEVDTPLEQLMRKSMITFCIILTFNVLFYVITLN